jgi:hypothetical protein
MFPKTLGTNMTPNIHPFYRHSGKFNPLGLVPPLIAAILVGLPLGLLYSYLIKWIPFIYLNFLLTFGYGFAFGAMTMVLLKFGNVRNSVIALLCGLAAGLIGWYFNWNGHINALIDHAPWLLNPRQIGHAVQLLYSTGSWSIGFSGHDPVTGIPLAFIWLCEGAIIVGISSLISYGFVSKTPFCEQHKCWLDEEKKIDKLDAFVSPAQLAALEQGDIAPLEEAHPRVPASGRFARLTLRYSDKCDDFCTLTIENIDVTLDKDNNPKEKSQLLMTNLFVPKTMFDYLAKFDHPTAKLRAVGAL